MASFGYGTGDILGLTKIAWDVVQNTRQAAGEHSELMQELTGLHAIVQRLQAEASNPESLISNPNPERKEELDGILSGCRNVLNTMNNIVQRYNALPPGSQKGLKRFFQKVRFGNGEMQDLGQWRQKIATHTSAISLFLNMVSIGSLGRIEKQMTGELRYIRLAVNEITASFLAAEKHSSEGSVFTTYRGDDRAVWREFRRELIQDGFDSTVIAKHKRVIKAYIRELGDRGLLDEDVDEPTPLMPQIPEHPQHVVSSDIGGQTDTANNFSIEEQTSRDATDEVERAPQNEEIPRPPTSKQSYVEDGSDGDSESDALTTPIPAAEEIIWTAEQNEQCSQPPIPNQPYVEDGSDEDHVSDISELSDDGHYNPVTVKLSSRSQRNSQSNPNGLSEAFVVGGIFFPFSSKQIAVEEVRRRLSTYVAYEITLPPEPWMRRLPNGYISFRSDRTMNVDVFIEDTRHVMKLISTIHLGDSTEPIDPTGRYNIEPENPVAGWNNGYWEKQTWTTVIVSKIEDPISLLEPTSSLDTAIWKREKLPNDLNRQVGVILSAHNEREGDRLYQWSLINIICTHCYGEEYTDHRWRLPQFRRFTRISDIKFVIQRAPRVEDDNILWKEYIKRSPLPTPENMLDQRFRKRQILQGIQGDYYPGLQLTTNLIPVFAKPGENHSTKNKQLVIFVKASKEKVRIREPERDYDIPVASPTPTTQEPLDESKDLKKGKTKIPARLVSQRAIISLGYPFQKEGDIFIIMKALSAEKIDEIIELSEKYKAGGESFKIFYFSLYN